MLWILLITAQLVSGVLYVLYSKKAEKTDLKDIKNFKKYTYISGISRGIMFGIMPIYLSIK